MRELEDGSNSNKEGWMLRLEDIQRQELQLKQMVMLGKGLYIIFIYMIPSNFLF